MTAEAYLAWEQEQTERHEFVDGEVFAMAGAGDAHVTVAMNVAFALREHLRGTPCRTYISDMRLQVEAVNSFFYPDVMVTCAELDQGSALQKTMPTLLVEVLSPSTAAYDRGAKFAAYRHIDSLREFVMIDPDTRSADVYVKGADGLWVLHPFAGDDSVRLASVGLELPASRLWADVIDA